MSAQAPATAAADRHVVAPEGRQGAALAIWPETDKSVTPSAFPGWRSSAKATAQHFAREVLGFAHPVVSVKSGGFHFQPGDRGYWVARAEGTHRIEVRVNRVVDSSHWSVDDVWGFGKHEYPATVDISKRHAYVGFGYWGKTSSAVLTLRYGDHHAKREATTEATWSFPISFPIDVSGAVLVLFRDRAGRVFTGWGTPLPAGRFSAG